MESNIEFIDQPKMRNSGSFVSNGNGNGIGNGNGNGNGIGIGIGIGNGGRGSTNQKLLKCLQHQRELEFLCQDCNLLLCANCVISSEHRGHVVNDYHSLYGANNKDDPTCNFNKRLNRLWSQLKEYGQRLEYCKLNESIISDYYHNIHEFLRLEEHKLKKPFISERESTEKLMDLNLKEMKSIHQILFYNSNQEAETSINPNTESHPFNESIEFVDLDLNEIAESIKKSKNVNEFIDTFKDTNLLRDSYQHSLLSQMQYLTSSANLKDDSSPQSNDATPSKIIFNDKILKEIKILFHQLYSNNSNSTILPNSININNGNSKSKILTFGGNGCYIFDLELRKWTKCETDNSEKRTCVQSSLVSTNEYVFVFGGKDKSNTYSRFNLQSLKWDYTKIISISSNNNHVFEGGSGISVCFDGHKYIYLIGGQCQEKILSRVDRLDLETMEFRRIGELLQPRYHSFSFIKGGSIYVVNGYNNYKGCKSIMEFKLEDGNCSYIIDDIPINGWSISECFDGNDLLYMYDSLGTFFSISISTFEIQILAKPKVTKRIQYRHPMFYLKSNSVIYLFGGNKHGNHQYSIELNKWTKLQDKDDGDRKYNGICEI